MVLCRARLLQFERVKLCRARLEQFERVKLCRARLLQFERVKLCRARLEATAANVDEVTGLGLELLQVILKWDFYIWISW